MSNFPVERVYAITAAMAGALLSKSLRKGIFISKRIKYGILLTVVALIERLATRYMSNHKENKGENKKIVENSAHLMASFVPIGVSFLSEYSLPYCEYKFIRIHMVHAFFWSMIKAYQTHSH